MTIAFDFIGQLSDQDLLAHVERAASRERHATAEMIALLMELDARRLYLAQGCSSLFKYCTEVLHLSEHAAYRRIEAARAARRFPTILNRLTDGRLNLTAVVLVAPHLTAANHIEVLDAALHKSKREVEQMVANLSPRPAVPPTVRKRPDIPIAQNQITVDGGTDNDPSPPRPLGKVTTNSPATVSPIAPQRYKIQITVARETYDRLRSVQDLLRHSIPNGDPAAIFE